MSDAKKVRASGRGLQPSGVRVGDVADFKIYTEGAGEGSPEVRVIGPGTCTFCQVYKRRICCCLHGYIPFQDDCVKGKYIVYRVYFSEENVTLFSTTEICRYQSAFTFHCQGNSL